MLVQVQSRAPIKLFTEKLPLWRFLLHLLPFYVAKIVNYYETHTTFTTYATFQQEFYNLYLNVYVYGYKSQYS